MITIQTTELFEHWWADLKDKRARAAIDARMRRAELGNFGDCKPVGEGVSEMRIHYGAGYRVYFMQRGHELIIVLAGGDKSTQSRDITEAIEIANKIRSES